MPSNSLPSIYTFGAHKTTYIDGFRRPSAFLPSQVSRYTYMVRHIVGQRNAC